MRLSKTLAGIFPLLVLGPQLVSAVALPQTKPAPAPKPAASKAPAPAAPKPTASKAPTPAASKPAPSRGTPASKPAPSGTPAPGKPLPVTAECAAQPLAPDTWTKLKLDDYVKTSGAKIKGTSNTVQALAGSFGAPNFFCGLDNFCNAGQPCSPVKLPDWYVLVATQNWNSYMNSVNTAVTFASSILSLTLPSIVNDFMPAKRDDATPFKNIINMFATVVGAVPVVGSLKDVAGGTASLARFLANQLKPPVQGDKFVTWSNVANSLGDAVKAYQASVSKAVNSVLNAPIGDQNGLGALLAGGSFLGVHQNVTQQDLQATVSASLTTFAVSLALTAQRVFVVRLKGLSSCDGAEDAPWQACPQEGDFFTQYMLVQADGGKTLPANDFAKLMSDKYGIPRDQYLFGVAKCFDDNGGKQLFRPFDDAAVPLDPKSPCVFNLPFCEQKQSDQIGDGIADLCRKKGLPI